MSVNDFPCRAIIASEPITKPAITRLAARFAEECGCGKWGIWRGCVEKKLNANKEDNYVS